MNVLMLDLISTYTNVINLYKSNSLLLGLLKGNIDLLNIHISYIRRHRIMYKSYYHNDLTVQ